MILGNYGLIRQDNESQGTKRKCLSYDIRQAGNF